MAFDVRLGGMCWERKLDCLIVAPQLMHHHGPPAREGFIASEAIMGDQDHAHDGDSETIDAVSLGMGGTENVLNSARCAALFNSTCQNLP
jgi:hypothetical protein